MPTHRTRIAVALISAVTIAVELLLMRALSLRFWYHFSSLIIATALLGFAASGTVLTLLSGAVANRRRAVLFVAAALMVLAIPAAVRAADAVPLNVQFLTWDILQAAHLVAIEMILMVPLLLAGICVGVALMDSPDRLPGHYAANLIGSGAGSAGAIILMQLLPLPQAVAVVSGAALLAAAAVAPWRRPSAAVLLAVVLVGWAATHWLSPWVPAVSQYKALANALRMPDTEVIARTEGPLGRIDVVAGPAIHAIPAGTSLVSPQSAPVAALITTDGDEASAVYRVGAGQGYEFMDWTTSALPYHLIDCPRVLILGSGGGEQIGLARYHKSPHVVAVEPNRQVIELMRGPLRRRGGAIYDAPNVHVLNRQSRGYLSSGSEKFALIQLAVGGGAVSTGAGPQAGREAYLFTVEAFEAMLSRLERGGMICVTCPSLSPPRAELRLLDVAAQALRSRGRQDPGEYVAVVRNYDAVSVLILDRPIEPSQASAMAGFCKRRSFDVAFISSRHGRQFSPLHTSRLRRHAGAAEAILGPGRDAFVRDYIFDVSATTDDRPYFYNFFRFRALPRLFGQLGNLGRSYLEVGYLLLLAALAQSAPVAAVLILLPLAGRGARLRTQPGKLRAFGYFLLIGLAFMFLEMMFIQRLTVYLAHPIYSAAVVIGAFLVFAGVGSRLSQRWRLPPRAVIRRAGAATTALAVAYVLVLKHLLAATQGWPLGGRAAVTIVALAPMAVAMGHMFPTALRCISRASPQLVPWCWAINGFASVVATVAATLLAMEIGFSLLALVGAGAYVLACVVWGRSGIDPH